jgi:hypothetical protein
MADPTLPVLSAVKSDPVSGQDSIIGKVQVQADGILNLVSATQGQETYLGNLVQSLNNKPLLHVSVSPPAGAPRYRVYSHAVKRSDPNFFDALQSFMTKHYGVFLTTAETADEAVKPDTFFGTPAPEVSPDEEEVNAAEEPEDEVEEEEEEE